MRSADWQTYSVIATGDGYKLERWGKVILLRPDPQVIWKSSLDMNGYKGLSAKYIRSESGGGKWLIKGKMPDEWTVSYKDLTFKIKPMGFKHTGLFPEQAVNWDLMRSLIENSGREINVLNLFAYTGGATVACAKSGAKVTHVDSAKGMVERAGENVRLSNVANDRVRYIIDDCKKFVEREIRRGNKYDIIIMDPPSYGRGPKGELWKIEESIFPFIKLTSEILSDDALFFLVNSYTTGLQPAVLSYMINLAIVSKFGGSVTASEIGLPVKDTGLVLPCGASGRWEK